MRHVRNQETRASGFCKGKTYLPVSTGSTQEDTSLNDWTRGPYSPISLTRILPYKVMFWQMTKKISLKNISLFLALSSNLSGLSNSGGGQQ